MDKLLKSISYVFHPVIIPLLAVALYFSKSPKFFSIEFIQAKLMSLFLLTTVLPIMLFFLLKTLRTVSSIHLVTTRERIAPLSLNILILLLVVIRVIPPYQIIELHYFFLGILFSTLSCLIMAILSVKASIHMIAISGIFMFAIALSLHFSINMNGTIGLLAILIGAIATSRLHLKAHDYSELAIGAFIGFFPQLILVSYWL